MVKKQLTEIALGSVKGLVGSIGCALMGTGLPVADALYESIETKTGRIAYNTTMVALAGLVVYGVLQGVSDMTPQRQN